MIRSFLVLALLLSTLHAASEPKHSKQKVVFQTDYGDIKMVLFPEIAPLTVAHILKLVELGCYNTNHFFRVDKGFVAQVADCRADRIFPLNKEQLAEADKTVKLEVVRGVVHVEGVISMGRTSDPDSNGSSFSILLGDAPHLDMQYTIFGKVISGMEPLRKMEKLETYKEGIFVRPKKRVTIHSAYVTANDSVSNPDEEAKGDCLDEWSKLQTEYNELAKELDRTRSKCFTT